MPGLARRRELDLRSASFESEARISDVQRFKVGGDGRHIQDKLFKCDKCHHLFRERSRNCPRCDTKTMMHVRPFPEAEREKFRQRRIREIRARLP